MDNINMKTIKYLNDRRILLDGKNVLTRIIDVKGESWRNYPTFYKIGDFYYVQYGICMYNNGVTRHSNWYVYSITNRR